MSPDQARAELAKRGIDWKTGKPISGVQQLGSAVKQSAQDIFKMPLAYARDLGTNPVSMANAMPMLGGMAGGLSPMVGGSTMGTAAGQGIRDLALNALKKPIPSGMQHAGELGGAALGDVLAIPALKRAHYGGQIGQAEKLAGVTTRASTKAVTPGTVGETLNTLEAQIDAGAINTPQAAKDAKEVVDQIYKNPRIYEQTPGIKVQSQRVSQKVSNVINDLIKGRKAPSDAMAQAMTIPNKVQKTWTSLPWPVKRAAQAYLGYEGIKKLLGQ